MRRSSLKTEKRHRKGRTNITTRLRVGRYRGNAFSNSVVGNAFCNDFDMFGVILNDFPLYFLWFWGHFGWFGRGRGPGGHGWGPKVDFWSISGTRAGPLLEAFGARGTTGTRIWRARLSKETCRSSRSSFLGRASAKSGQNETPEIDLFMYF